jgi:hypothetical protein
MPCSKNEYQREDKIIKNQEIKQERGERTFECVINFLWGLGGEEDLGIRPVGSGGQGGMERREIGAGSEMVAVVVSGDRSTQSRRRDMFWR